MIWLSLEFNPNQDGIVIPIAFCLKRLSTGYEPHDRGSNCVHGMSLSALAVQRLSNLAKSIIRLCFGAVLGTLLCFLNTQARHRLLPVGQMNNNVEAA
ncbi:hypothetical protein ALQ75_04253, partial [Pseudomonas savastanoi pv. glycinea]